MQQSQSDISVRYKVITKRLNTDFWGSDSDTLHSRYVGSYGRDTAIRNFHDLDVLFEMPNSVYHQYDAYTGNKQSALLQAVRISLLKTYPTTDIGGDGQVVVVRFSDGMRFEVVPGFLNSDNLSFTYPDSNGGGSWRITNPLPEIATLNQANKEWNKNLKRLCRMARAWRRTSDVAMGGLLIDTLAYNFLKTWEYRNNSFSFYDWMSRDFFRYLSNQNRDQQYWLALGSNQLVWRKGPFEQKAKQAYEASLEAMDHDNNDRPYSAASKWKEIYGNFYPNPG